ncbi:hypothetical protein BSKO_06394 [Bryopsis sp. KO-2023]|nr:hypothetical protein BSKO_06394 [Bryopsis sp. KO-2023]
MLRRTAVKALGTLRGGTQQSSLGAGIFEADGFACGAESRRNYGHQALALQNNTLRKGPGGRSSVSGVVATVFGATGFLGRYVVNALAKMGSQVVVPYRCDDMDMQHIRQMGDLGQIICLPDFDVRDESKIKHAISQSSVVINLMGAQLETWNFSYNDIHVEAARRVAQIAKASPLVERFIHVSALGADTSASSERLKSKLEGEKQVLEVIPESTVFRPGYIVGIEDRFYNVIASLGKSLPYIPLIDGGATRVQPVYVRDVADALLESLKSKDTCGKTYNLAGPDILTMAQAVDLVFDEMREKRTTMYFPAPLAKMFVLPHTLLHKKLPLHFFSHMLTADFINELSKDNVLPADVLTFADLGMEPRSVVQGLPVDHVRFWRAGGYDFGATAGTQEA